MKRKLIICCLVLASCAPQMHWNKLGSTQKDYNQAEYDCTNDALHSAPPNYYQANCNMWSPLPMCQTFDYNVNLRGQLFNKCMGLKGWELR